MPTCAGCLEMFTAQGYRTHLRLTRNPPCTVIYTNEVSYGPTTLENFGDLSDDEKTDLDDSDDADQDPVVFEGDLFGDNYTEEDFGLDDNDLESDEDGDDEMALEDVAVAAHEQGWEPLRALEVGGPEQPEAEMDVDHNEALHGQDDRREAEDRLRRKPVVVHFPGGCAGIPIPNSQHRGSQQRYRAELGENLAANPWAPFSSRIDWEIAKWAKTRGPGSTAFTELLNINGVRILSVYYVGS